MTQREPAAPGEWVSIYATGLGKISGRIETGARAPMSPLLETLAPVHAQIDSRAIEVSVACLAPGFVGLYQINARIPFDLAAGTHNLQLTGAAQAGNAVPIDIR